MNAAAPFDAQRDRDLRATVAKGVVEQRVDDPLEQIDLDRDADGARGRESLTPIPAVAASSTHRRDGGLDALPGVTRRPRETCFLTRGREERLDRTGHLLRVALNGREAATVVVPRPLSPKGELALGGDLGKRGAKLVRQLRGEALLVPKARREALEHRVKRGGESRQLVVRLAAVEAPVEVVVAPCGGIVGHPGHGKQRLAEDPVAQERDCSEQCERESDRADERDRRGLGVGLQRNAGDDVPTRFPSRTTGIA